MMHSLFTGFLIGIAIFIIPIVIGMVLFFILILRIRGMFRNRDDEDF